MNKFLRNFTFICLMGQGVLANSSTSSSVSYENFYRLNDPAEKSEYNDWAQMEFQGEMTKWNAKFYGEFAARAYFSEEAAFNFSVPEAYVEFKDDSNRLSIGRQKLNWNENEDYWLLNTLNPAQGFYMLSEKKEGLTGIQYDRKFNNNLTFSLFFSYFYVPALNPGLDVEDGQITSKSEWVKTPPKYTVIEGSTVPIYYNINMPEAYNDVVKNKSLGFRMSGTNESKTSEISAFFVYKPENDFKMNADASFDMPNDQVVVDAYPVVNHHMYYGIQYKQSLGDVQVVAGFDMSDPTATFGNDLGVDFSREEGKTFESEYFSIEPNYEKESYATLSANINQGFYMISFNYIKLLTNTERGSDDFYSDTSKWKNAIGARGRYYLTDSLNFMGDIKYDFSREDALLKAEASYRLFRNAKLNVGAELVRSPTDNSYWSAYRANDTVYTSLEFRF